MKNHTFVIPAYNDSPYLEECIKSLKNQTIESNIIISSAKETDYLNKLSEKYNIPLIINPNGGGIGKDWNLALNNTNTSLVTIAHQDDIYTKDYLKNILESYKKSPNSIIYFTDYHEIRDNVVVEDNINLKIKKLLLFPFKMFPKHFTQKLAIQFGSAICCPSVTYNMDELKDYKFDEELKSDLDWKAWVEFTKDNKQFSYIPKALTLHRIHSGSETSKIINDSNRQKEDIEILNLLWPNWISKLIEFFYKYSEKNN